MKPPRQPFGQCTYCRRELQGPRSGAKTAITRDHVMPKCVGGQRKVRCCLQCNRLKGDLHPSVWRWFTEAHPEWWRTFVTNAEVTAVCRPHWGQAVSVRQVGRAMRSEMEQRQVLASGEGIER